MLKCFRKFLRCVLVVVGTLGIVVGVLSGQATHAQASDPDVVIRVHGDPNIGYASPPGANPGENVDWSNPYRYVQDALQDARDHLAEFPTDSVEVWVAGSANASDTWRTYYPDDGANPTAVPGCSTGGSRCFSFLLINNVRILGGFESGDTSVTDRMPEWHVQCDRDCEVADTDGIQDYDECMFDCAKAYVESQQDP